MAYPWAIGYRLRHGMPPPVRLVRLLRVSKRGVLMDTTLVDASLHDEFLHERQDTDLDLSLAQTTFHVRHLFVQTGHTQMSFISSRSWRLTRVFLHALLRCADHLFQQYTLTIAIAVKQSGLYDVQSRLVSSHSSAWQATRCGH